MEQSYPRIEHIDQIRPALEGRNEFTITTGDNGFLIADYYAQYSDTFSASNASTNALRRECRGLMFHADGTIARRAFHKFFNVGEHEEANVARLEELNSYSLYEKLDGSMVAPCIGKATGQVYWASKRGSEKYHKRLSSLYAGTSYEEFARETSEDGLTAIFEFCNPENRIIVDYPKASLTLLAIRETISGKYLSKEEILSRTKRYSLPFVKEFSTASGNINGILKEIRFLKQAEGAVLMTAQGPIAKLKGEWYCQLHKVLRYFDYEKDIARLILSGEHDDLSGILNPAKKDLLLAYEASLQKGLKKLHEQLYHWQREVLLGNIDKKSFALMQEGPTQMVKSIIFLLFGNPALPDLNKKLVEEILKQTATASKWEKFKESNGLTLEWKGQNNMN